MTHMNDQAVQAATRWYGVHQGEHLTADRQQMIDRCARDLSERYEISRRAAGAIAVKVWGDLQPRQSDWRIDLDETTPNVLVLRRAQGETPIVLGVDELMPTHLPAPRWIGVDMGHPDGDRSTG